jgi:hypothetical protein
MKKHAIAALTLFAFLLPCCRRDFTSQSETAKPDILDNKEQVTEIELPKEGKYVNYTGVGLTIDPDGPFGSRAKSLDSAIKSGGGKDTEHGVLLGLVWLKNHQSPNGMWSGQNFTALCREGPCSGVNTSPRFNLGLTSLAVLAFTGAGHTDKIGKFKRTVKNAMKAIMERQLPNGCFVEKGDKQSSDGHWIYGQILATMAMCELVGIDHLGLNRVRYGKKVQNAVDYLVKCKNPYLGWGYGYQLGDNNTWFTSWAVLALHAASKAGFKVPDSAFDGAKNWYNKVTDEESGRADYTSWSSQPSSKTCIQTMTAATHLCRILMGERIDELNIRAIGRILMEYPPNWGEGSTALDMYNWHFRSLALFQLGDPYWARWNKELKKALLNHQRKKGCECGSWDPIGSWGQEGGRVYSTAICTLTLETYYRYSRIGR